MVTKNGLWDGFDPCFLSYRLREQEPLPFGAPQGYVLFFFFTRNWQRALGKLFFHPHTAAYTHKQHRISFCVGSLRPLHVVLLTVIRFTKGRNKGKGLQKRAESQRRRKALFLESGFFWTAPH